MTARINWGRTAIKTLLLTGSVFLMVGLGVLMTSHNPLPPAACAAEGDPDPNANVENCRCACTQTCGNGSVSASVGPPNSNNDVCLGEEMKWTLTVTATDGTNTLTTNCNIASCPDNGKQTTNAISPKTGTPTWKVYRVKPGQVVTSSDFCPAGPNKPDLSKVQQVGSGSGYTATHTPSTAGTYFVDFTGEVKWPCPSGSPCAAPPYSSPPVPYCATASGTATVMNKITWKDCQGRDQQVDAIIPFAGRVSTGLIPDPQWSVTLHAEGGIESHLAWSPVYDTNHPQYGGVKVINPPDVTKPSVGKRDAIYFFPDTAKPGDSKAVSVACGSSSAKLNIFAAGIDTDSDNDGVIRTSPNPPTGAQNDDKIEDQAPGRYVVLNDPVNSQNLARVEVSFPSVIAGGGSGGGGGSTGGSGAPNYSGYTVKFTPTSGIQVWEDTNRTQNAARIVPATSQQIEYTPQNCPSLLYVEGTTQGNASLTMLIKRGGIDLCTDLDKFTVIQAKIRVDGNRDGTIAFDDDSDLTTKEKPFKFWLNNDRDLLGAADAGELDDADPSSGSPDFMHTKIANTRDLEDFTRVQIKPPSIFDATDTNWSVKLQMTDISQSSPGINVWKALKSDLSYLTNEEDAQAMVGQPVLKVVNANQPQEIPLDLFKNDKKIAALLFDARIHGKGALTVRFYKNNNLIIEDKTYLDLKPMAEMYEHYTVGDTTSLPFAAIPPVAHPATFFHYDSKSPEEKDYILFVHGWRMQPWERRAFAETSYKRLWHEGYKGRFGLFSWPTEWQLIDTSLLYSTEARKNYDRSERKSYLSARGLLGVLKSLNQKYPGKVRLFAHSLGNPAVGEALRQEAMSPVPQKLLHTYVPTQAAIAAHVYDPTAEDVSGGWFYDDGTPNAYSNYPPTPGKSWFSRDFSGFPRERMIC